MEKNKIIIETENLIKEAANLNCGILFNYFDKKVIAKIEIFKGATEKEFYEEILIQDAGWQSATFHPIDREIKLFANYVAYLVKSYNKEEK